jgi:hypothetical protein
MGITVAAMHADTKSVEVTFGGETAVVIVRPSKLTPELESNVSELAGSAGFVELLAGLLVSWEVIGEDGAPIEPTAENLRKLPALFLVEVVKQVTAALTPKALTA